MEREDFLELEDKLDNYMDKKGMTIDEKRLLVQRLDERFKNEQFDYLDGEEEDDIDEVDEIDDVEEDLEEDGVIEAESEPVEEEEPTNEEDDALNTEIDELKEELNEGTPVIDEPKMKING